MRPRTRKIALTAVLLAGLTLTSAATGSAQSVSASPEPGPVVRTAAGFVRGASADTTDRYLGIPYAAPPVGDLRWRAPRPATPWWGVRDATTLSPRCVQHTTAPTSEDCLYLTVHTPKGAARGPARYPVMVYIHGGSFATGMGGHYDPTAMVESGTIVVTINYRLGALGFLAHPALAAPDGSSGNYGLMDQQAALRWVQRDIGRFGGRADNVTIFGESAGGHSVLAHLASPRSAGLFSAAINQSGAYNLRHRSLADAEAEGAALSSAAGCPDQRAECLRALPPTALLAKQKPIIFLHTDGAVLPRSLDTAFRTGAFHRVPVINGTTRDESTFFVARSYDLIGQRVTAENLVTGIQAMTGVSRATAEEAARLYPLADYPSPAAALSAAATDATFACPAWQVDGWLSPRVPTFAYEFTDRNAPQLFLPPVSFSYGASHASELQYLFRLSNVVFPASLTEDQEALAATMREHWTDFAKTGRPAGRTEWPAYSAADPRMISYAPPAPGWTAEFAADHRCAFWSALA